MKLICYGSSSRGNGYILQGKDEILLIEAGLPVSNVRKRVNDFAQIKGCIVSHRHGDHSKYIADFMKAGITVYAPGSVFCQIKEPEDKRVVLGNPLEPVKIGGFTVIPMHANHDVTCYAYHIHHNELGKMLFVTDSAGFDGKFEGLRHIMIECNWSEACIKKAIDEGRTSWDVAERSMTTHMGLEVMIDYLKSEKLTEEAEEVILLHLSHENSDEKNFIGTAEKELQKPVYVAKRGFEIELSNDYEEY